MNRIFVNHITFSFLVISKLLNLNEASSSCINTTPDPRLTPLLLNGGLNFSLTYYHSFNYATNVFISPFSILMTLGMATEGAAIEEQNFNDVSAALNINGAAFIIQAKIAFQQYLLSLCPNDKFTLSISNQMYRQNNFYLEPGFIENLKTSFSSGADDVDFWNNPGGVYTYVEQWVEQQTMNTIKDFIFSFSEGTVALLINAIYFNGRWETPFDAAYTVPRAFTTAKNQSIQVPTMFSRNLFKYGFNSKVHSHVLRLNYEGGRLAMFIVLPAGETNLTFVRQKLSYDVLESVDKFPVEAVDVYLPKFKVSFEELTIAALDPFAFRHLWGNLSRMTTNAEIKAQGFAHQGFVEVDEAGSVAAAATAFEMHLNSPTPPFHPPRPDPFLPPTEIVGPSLPIVVKVERACLYLICDVVFKQVLFMGNLDDPLLIETASRPPHGS